MMKNPAIVANSMTLYLSTALFLFGCMAAAAPAGQVVEKLPIETVWASNQSGHVTSRPVALWVTDSSRFNALARENPSRAAAVSIEKHRVDWLREGIVWLYMGRKTTGGYALSLAAAEATVSNGIAVIRVQWREPSPGAIVTQQLTSPCLVLKLPRNNYSAIEIQDQAGRMRTRVAVKSNE